MIILEKINMVLSENNFSLSQEDDDDVLYMQGEIIHEGIFNRVSVSYEELKKSKDKWIGLDVLKSHNQIDFGEVIGSILEVEANDERKALVGKVGVIDRGMQKKIKWREKLKRPNNVSISFGATFEVNKEDRTVSAKDINPDHLAFVRKPADKRASLNISFTDSNVSNIDDYIEFSQVDMGKWTRAYINDLPDSAFAFVEPEYGKTSDNKNMRHLPYKDKNGNIDPTHLINALARVNQIKPLGATSKEVAIKKAMSVLRRAVATYNKQHPNDKIKANFQEGETMEESNEQTKESNQEEVIDFQKQLEEKNQMIVEFEEKIKGMNEELSELRNFKEEILAKEKSDLLEKIVSYGLEKDKYEKFELSDLNSIVEGLIKLNETDTPPLTKPEEEREEVDISDGIKMNVDEIDKYVRNKLKGSD